MKPQRIALAAVVFALLGLTESTGASTNAHAAWQQALKALNTPTAGCFTAAYPHFSWRRVACVTAPNLPYVPWRGHRPFTVGGNNDFAGEVTGTMLSTEGSFDSVSGVTSETGQVGGSGGQVANTYSLQINTKPFTTSVCSTSPTCQGWQQFLYSSSNQMIFIQYWLLRFNTTCPSGWTTFQFPADTDIYCFRNSPATTVAKQAITNLANLRLVGSANASGNDTVTMFVGNTSFAQSNAGTMLNLGSAWTGAEFIIVGDCCSSQANFNAGSTIMVRTTVHNGTTNAPTCVLEGFTGETNNLNLVGTAAVGTGNAPAVVSRQSNTLTSTASCSAANGTGDTHLTTFNGLLYDFQAAGDFLYAQTGSNFLVQTRQVSGAPTWPDASVNSAVATRMGKTRVALCLPERLEVNGRPRPVSQGSSLILPNDIDISHTGNVYVIRGPQGQSVRAELHDKWIDVSVGLGRLPQTVTGLLANARNNVRQVATRGGVVLTWPIPFKTIYSRYGNSWRVSPRASILCKAKRVESSNPARPFYAKDLEPEVARRAGAICLKFGVRNKALLEACTLDVAVTGRADAARVYRGAQPPVVVGRPR
jgi:hypothetical protein